MNIKPGDCILLKQTATNRWKVPDYLHMQWVTVVGLNRKGNPYAIPKSKYENCFSRRRDFTMEDIVAVARNGSYLMNKEEDKHVNSR